MMTEMVVVTVMVVMMEMVVEVVMMEMVVEVVVEIEGVMNMMVEM